MAQNDATRAGDNRGRYDNLGWLAGSSVLPKKRKEIEGVSATSAFEMQAQLLQVQEHARQMKDGTLDPSEKHIRRKAGFTITDLVGARNAGVEERDKRDKLAIKSTATRASECYAALERKAKLYEKLARGEANDDEDKYEVDFLRKDASLEDERDAPSHSGRQGWQQPIDSVAETVGGSGGMMSRDMERERERRRWENEEHETLVNDSEVQEKRRQHKEVIMELAQETKESRARAAAVKAQKEEHSQQKVNKLKESFLKEQLKKRMAAQGTLSSGGGQ